VEGWRKEEIGTEAVCWLYDVLFVLFRLSSSAFPGNMTGHIYYMPIYNEIFNNLTMCQFCYCNQFYSRFLSIYRFCPLKII